MGVSISVVEGDATVGRVVTQRRLLNGACLSAAFRCSRHAEIQLAVQHSP
jgi:hypothetical protein